MLTSRKQQFYGRIFLLRVLSEPRAFPCFRAIIPVEGQRTTPRAVVEHRWAEHHVVGVVVFVMARDSMSFEHPLHPIRRIRVGARTGRIRVGHGAIEAEEAALPRPRRARRGAGSRARRQQRRRHRRAASGAAVLSVVAGLARALRSGRSV